MRLAKTGADCYIAANMIVHRNMTTAAPVDALPGERLLLELDGVRVPVVSAGEGPTVLFVHGIGHDMTDWSELYARRPPGLRYVALDLPGFGEAGVPDPIGKLDLALMVRAIRAAGELGEDAPLLVGSSLGGHLGMLAAIEGMPVAGLMLLSPGGLERFPPALKQAALMYWSADAICARTESMVLEANQRLFVRRTARIERMMQRALMRHRADDRRVRAEIIETVVHDVMRRPVRDQLDRLPRPVEVLWGDADVLVPRGGIDALAALPGVRLHVLERTGHLPMFEQPDLVTEHIQTFTDRLFARAPALASGAGR